MTLMALIALPLLAAPVVWWLGRDRPSLAGGLTLVALVADLALAGTLVGVDAGADPWLMRWQVDWIPRFGIQLLLAVDGLGLLMVLLTLGLGVAAVLASMSDIHERPGFYFFHMLLAIAGTLGVFLALDLFLFFFFWELMLVPMYFLISYWGHEERDRAAIKFFIFTQASGLIMLLAILGLVWAHHAGSGELTFSYFALRGAVLEPQLGFWLMLGFFLAFTVKLPMVPLHTWLPDAHTQAPTGGSVLLAGVLLKTGGYGLLRFVLPLFPEASAAFAPVALWLGAAGVLYGAVLAFGQEDVKRLVAYSSVSHMGFVLMGVFAFNMQAWQGTVLQMLAHGLTTGALFVIAGLMQHHFHTRDMKVLGGLWHQLPRFGVMAMFFAVASLGMPGLANFVGEFLILLGSFRADAVVTAVAALGLIGAAVYSLILIQRVFQGPETDTTANGMSLAMRERFLLGALAVPVVVLGLAPQPVIELAAPALGVIENLMPSGVLP